MKNIYLAIFVLPMLSFAQSGLETTIKAGEIILSGFSIIKAAKSNKSESKFIESICVKNKLSEKITFKIEGKDAQGDDVKKELVVQNDGKECVFSLPKGIYAYEVILSNKEIYKKGEYKFDDDVIITVKKEN